MRADDIMTKNIEIVSPDADIHDVAKTLLGRGVSSVPVVDERGHVLGIISEGDLMRRPEMGTERHPSWWLNLVSDPKNKVEEYVRTHSQHAGDVMTRQVITVSKQTPIGEIAAVLERHRIKQVPVVQKSKLVGMVSRASLLRGLIDRQPANEGRRADSEIRKAIWQEVQESGVWSQLVDVVVSDGVTHLWGAVRSDAEKNALSVAAENTDGVTTIVNHIGVMPQMVRGTLGGV